LDNQFWCTRLEIIIKELGLDYQAIVEKSSFFLGTRNGKRPLRRRLTFGRAHPTMGIVGDAAVDGIFIWEGMPWI